MKHTYRAAIVGAGGISASHIEALKSVPYAEVTAVVDVDAGRARALARAAGVEAVYDSVEALIAANVCDVAHVLVPPDRHRFVAEPLLRAGIHVLCEKPMATSVPDCEALIEAAEAGGACLSINHTMLFHPTYREVQRLIDSGELGPLHHVICVWSSSFSPLRQLGHWAFQSPENVVFEQAIHPLSQIAGLAGKPLVARALVSEPVRSAGGVVLHDTWQASMRLERATAQLFYSVGHSFEVRDITAVCADGVIEADFVAGTMVVRDRSHLVRPLDELRSGLTKAAQLVAATAQGFASTVAGSLALSPRCSPDLAAMTDSVADFYAGLAAKRPHASARLGAALVGACEQITRDVARPRAAPARITPVSTASGPCDVVIFGGGGFIGRGAARALAKEGLNVRVVVRNPACAADLSRTPGIEIVRGDARSPEDVERAVHRARAVVDAVLPREQGNQDEQMTAIARGIAQSCMSSGVAKLVYLSSIESLYLGDADETITGSTPPDPRSKDRDRYSRGKADCERMLLAMHREQGLPVCVLRPGIVVGAGGLARHAGVGRWVNEQYCVGFYSGRNPLPFVLIDDVADAICKALRSERSTGRTYNLVGDVRLTAREYVAELRRLTGRPIRFHEPPAAEVVYAAGMALTTLKRMAGRQLDLPYLGDIKHLRMLAHFDCDDIQRDLGWTPVADRAEFIRRGIAVHAPELTRAGGGVAASAAPEARDVGNAAP